MKNYCIKAVDGVASENFPQSLHIMDGNNKIAIIYSTGEITFAPQRDYLIEEIKYFCKVSKLFYSFYNNIKN